MGSGDENGSSRSGLDKNRVRMRLGSADVVEFELSSILVPRGRAPFGQHQELRPLAQSNNGSPRFTDFPSLCACSESSVMNLIGSGLNLLCLQIHSKPECRWTWPEVAILGADQKERGLWGREWLSSFPSPEPTILRRSSLPDRLCYRDKFNHSLQITQSELEKMLIIATGRSGIGNCIF